MIGLLLLFPLLALAASENPLSPGQATWIFAIAIAMIPLLTVLKISVGALWTAAVGYLVLRLYGFSWRAMLTGLATGVVFLIVIWALSPSTHDYKIQNQHPIIPFYLFRLFWPISLSSYAIPLLLLFSKIRLYGGDGLGRAFSAKSDLMFEATTVVLALGSIPPLIGIPQDSAVGYFLNVAQWMAMALLAARFAPNFPWPARNVLLRAFPIISMAAGFTLLLWYPVYTQAATVVLDTDARSGGKLLHGRSTSKYFFETVKKEHALWGREFRDSLAATTGAQLIQAVRRAIPQPDRTAAVFIPPENRGFWSRSPTCLMKFNSQVSLTGQPSLLGGPPRCDTDAYTSNYGPQFQSHDLPDSQLCEHARQRNIRHVLIFAEDRPSDRNRMLDCGSGKGS